MVKGAFDLQLGLQAKRDSGRTSRAQDSVAQCLVFGICCSLDYALPSIEVRCPQVWFKVHSGGLSEFIGRVQRLRILAGFGIWDG